MEGALEDAPDQDRGKVSAVRARGVDVARRIDVVCGGRCGRLANRLRRRPFALEHPARMRGEHRPIGDAQERDARARASAALVHGDRCRRTRQARSRRAAARSPSNAQALRARQCGIVTSVSSSPGSRDVLNRPVKKSAARTVRDRSRLRKVNTASSASITAGSSAAGSACARLPPSVPRVRIAACATKGIAAATSGASRATTALCSSARCRVMPPICNPLPPRWTRPESAGDLVQIDEHRGRRQAEVHGRNEALAAGQRLGVGAVLGQQVEGFVERSRTEVVERRRFHEPLGSASMRVRSSRSSASSA